METDGENDRAQRPVGKHTDPDSNRAESPYPAEINAQAYPAQPHGAAGGNHGEFYVTCSAHAIALLMLADLIQYFSEYAPPETASGHGNRTIRELISYVNEHYTEKLSLEDAADYVGFSREYFCRFFKQHMGLTFLRYLNEVRISHAGRLLSSTDLSISEIMNTCGFTNQTIFNRLFKEIYGMTPRQARKTLSVS